jgi:hypothetical protein
MFDINWRVFFSLYSGGLHNNAPINIECIIFKCDKHGNNLFDVQGGPKGTIASIVAR